MLQFIILLTAGYFFIKGHITYATFIMLEMYIWRIDEVVESISEFGVSYNKVTVSLKRIGEIVNNELYEAGTNQQYNALIQFFNNKDIDSDTVKTIENIVYSSYNNELYFLIPMLIYIIDENIKLIMNKK